MSRRKGEPKKMNSDPYNDPYLMPNFFLMTSEDFVKWKKEMRRKSLNGPRLRSQSQAKELK